MIYAFILLTFIISWGIDFVLPEQYLDITMFVPGIVAILITILSKDRLISLFRPSSIMYILQGLLTSCLVAALFIAIAEIFSVAKFGLPKQAIDYAHGSAIHAWFRVLFLGLPYLFSINLVFTTGEELGWRGFLLSKLALKFNSFLGRSLLVGIIWGTWHLPIYIKAGFPLIKISVFLLNICLISIVYTWLFEKSHSIWPTSVAHAMHNALFNSLLPIVTLTQTTNQLLLGEEGLLVTLIYSLVILIAAFSLKYYQPLSPKDDSG